MFRHPKPSSVVLACLVLGFLSSQGLLAARPEASLDQLITSRPFDRAAWGVLVQEEDGSTVFARNERQLFTPASVRKLFSAATIASCMSLESGIDTELSLTGDIRSGIVEGDLIIRGYGDPSFAGRYFDRRDSVLEPILDALRQKGVRRIRGSVVADASYFARESLPGGWKSDNIGESWAAIPAALNYNENVVGIFVGPGRCDDPPVSVDPWFPRIQTNFVCGSESISIEVGIANDVVVSGSRRQGSKGVVELAAVSDPALFAAQAVTSFLRLNGIAVDGVPGVAPIAVRGSVPLVTLSSPSLFTLLGTMLEESTNLYAEVLLERLSGGAVVSADRQSSLDLERRVLSDEIGVDAGGFRFEDGSGLSVEDLAAPEAVLSVINWMSEPSRRAIWQELLATPGEGTLRRRLLDLKGRVWVKTGSLDGVNALAGWLITKRGSLRRFVIIVNHHTQPGWMASDRIDAIVRVIAE